MLWQVVQGVADGLRVLLEAAQLLQIEAAIGSLRELSKTERLRDIEQGIEALGHATEDFAARRMDEGIRKALTGKTIDGVHDTFVKQN